MPLLVATDLRVEQPGVIPRRLRSRTTDVDEGGSHKQTTEDAGEERVGSQPVGTVVLVVALADRVEAGEGRLLVAD